MSGQERDPRTDERKPSEHVQVAIDEIAMATAKAMVAGVRVPDSVYQASVSLTLWLNELEARGK
jgi:hypothetical protein